jgi:1,4-alpha-glucan branching enzyme
MKSSIAPHDLHSLQDLASHDPFAHLGYHHFTENRRTSGLIRVFNPAFKSVEIITEILATPCDRVSGNGCFEALFPDRLEFFPYRIRATLHDGQTVEYVDPYSFLPVLSDYDLYLFNRGTHYKLWEKLGAHAINHHGVQGVHFSVWAPNAKGVSVIGDFNGWNPHSHMLRRLSFSGVWETFAPLVEPGATYKFLVHNLHGGKVEKADPYARESELRPKTASLVAAPSQHAWGDVAWDQARARRQADDAPLCIYEVHAGSWRRKIEESPGFLDFDELARELIPYVKDMGYTHIELLPVMEHPLDESWGYQVTGYYSPSRRYGTPDQFRRFVDQCHQAGIGVLLDWVPAHFPSDLHGLEHFDGTELYAHEDPRKGAHPQWGTRIFNYERHEVANFLIANALYWMEEFHIDGLRVDAVASMLYLDYARNEGEWVPASDGGNINHGAVEFLKHLNAVVHDRLPGRLIIAEESSAFPGISHGLDRGGLGFSYKWNMGWMNDFLSYMSKDPIYRKFHQGLLTFEMSYAFSERYCLVLSHDEVVHGKSSLLQKMPGDDWQKFANVRAAFAYQYAHPGKKLHFMGLEFGQWQEWSEARSLDWHLLDQARHSQLQDLLRTLNRLYREEAALHAMDTRYEGFQWVDFQDQDANMVSFLRKSRPDGNQETDGDKAQEIILCVLNFSPVPRHHYRLGVPRMGYWRELFNSDSAHFGGSNVGNLGGHEAETMAMHHFAQSIEVSAPPLGAVYFKWQPKA